MVLPYKRLQTVHECLNRIKAQRALAWLVQALQQYICLIFWKLNKNFQNKASGHGVIFSYDSNKNIFLIDCLQSHIKIAPCHWGLIIVGWKTEHLDDGMKLYEWFNDCTITGYQIIIFEETGMIKFENQNLSRYQFCGKEYLLGLNFELNSHKTEDFTKIILWKHCFCSF